MITKSRLAQLFAPPHFADEDDASVAELLYITLIATLVGATGYTIFLPIIAPEQINRLVIVSIALPLVFGLLSLIRHGYLKFTSFVLTVGLWLLLTVAAFTSGGVRGPAFNGYIVVVIIAALLLGKEASIIVAVASIFSGASILFGVSKGYLNLDASQYSATTMWLAQSIFFFVTSALLFMAARSLNMALTRARTSEQRIERLLKNSPDIIAVYDLTLRKISLINRDTLYGYTNDEVEMLDVIKHAIHPADYEAVQSHWIGIITDPSDEVHTTEFRILGKDDSIEWIRSRQTVLARTPDQSPAQCLMTLTNITEQKQAEAQLQLALQAEQQARETADVLSNANRELTKTLELDHVFYVLLSYLQQLIPYDTAAVMLLEDEDTLSVSAARGPTSWVEQIYDVTYDISGYSILEKIVQSCQSVLIADTHIDPEWEPTSVNQGFQNWLGVPLIAGGKIVGMYSMFKQEPAFFSEVHQQLAEALATQAAIAINNAQLYQEAEQQATHLSAIYDVSQHLLKLHTPDTLSQAIVQLLEDQLVFEFSAVFLVDQTTSQLIPFAVSGQDKGLVFIEADKAYITSHGIVGWVAQTGRSVRLGDVRQDPRYFAMHNDIRSELCVPLISGDQVIGALNVETTRLNAYSESDQLTLETVAAFITIAVQNSGVVHFGRAAS